jgi:hypothetical protein
MMGQKLAIQGRAFPFDDSEVIPLDIKNIEVSLV